jgi:thiol-disulfide isomerase/thioredoxin
MRSSAVAALDDPSPGQLRTAIEGLLEHIWAKHDLSGFPPFEYRAAEAYVAHGVNLERVPFLVEKGLGAIQHNLEEDRKRDDTPPEDLEDDRRNIDTNRVEGLRILIDLYTKTKEPAKAAAALAEVRKFPPQEGFGAPFYRQAARVAQLQGRHLDALLHFQTAFDRWTGPPAGKQEIAAEIERVWKELGGTSDARALLGSHRPGAAVADNDAAWKKPEAPIPPFELEDTNGRMWRLKTLSGKTVLLNVWATWCGPCVAEHPEFQKLYDKLKDRPGIQVLTLNIDENVAEIALYMKQHGYTFPVIPARPMVELMLPRVSIPRNWIVDSKGNLQWEQRGYGSQNTEWEKRLLDMLEKTAGTQ